MKEESMNNEKSEKLNPESAPVEPGALSQTPPEFLSKEEVALRLKRTVRTVEIWQRRGILPYVKCENTVLFNWAEVVAHLQKNYRVCRQRSFGPPVRLPVYQMRDETKPIRARRRRAAKTQNTGNHEHQSSNG